jgi:hypothetical protein
MTALQLECVAKIMQLGTEAQENLSVLQEENKNITESLAASEQQCNSSMVRSNKCNSHKASLHILQLLLLPCIDEMVSHTKVTTPHKDVK